MLSSDWHRTWVSRRCLHSSFRYFHSPFRNRIIKQLFQPSYFFHKTAEGAFVDKGFFKTQYAAGGFNPNAKEFYPLQMPTPPLEEMAQEKLAQPSTAYGFAGGAHHTHAHHHHQTPSPVSSNGVVPAQGVAHVQSQGIHPQLHHDTDRAASPSKPHHPQMSLNVQPQHTHMHAMPSVVTYSPVTQQQPVSEPIHAQTFPEVIREVWRETLEEAMEDMSALVHDGYNCVGMDTEFPGVVARAPSSTTVNGVKGYASMWQTIRVNVNILKVIQIGMCFRDKDGKAPEDRPSTFQINFHFDLDKDIYAVDSISMLQNSGIEFDILKYVLVVSKTPIFFLKPKTENAAATLQSSQNC